MFSLRLTQTESLSMYEIKWVYCELYVSLRSVKDLILHGNKKKKKTKKSSLKTLLNPNNER